MSFSRTAEFFRIDARLSAAEAGGGLENGLRSAKQAAELEPDGVPYLLLLARAERAAGDGADARIALETILADHPEHPVATKLLAELEAADAVADAGVEVDAGVAETAAGQRQRQRAEEAAAEQRQSQSRQARPRAGGESRGRKPERLRRRLRSGRRPPRSGALRRSPRMTSMTNSRRRPETTRSSMGGRLCVTMNGTCGRGAPSSPAETIPALARCSIVL